MPRPKTANCPHRFAAARPRTASASEAAILTAAVLLAVAAVLTATTSDLAWAQARPSPAPSRAAGPGGRGITLEKGSQILEYQNTNQIGLGDLDGDGDLDRDGDLDIFMVRSSEDQGNPTGGWIYLNDGHGRFTDSGQYLGDSAHSGNVVYLLDVEGDGDLDALVVYYQQPDRLYLNDGRGHFTDSGRRMPEYAIPGDLDGDGDIDLFLREEGSGFRALLNDGTGTIREHWALADTALLRGFVELGDVDGDVDAVVTNGDMQVQRPTRILLNDGMGRFTDSGQELPFARVGRAVLGDLDGDDAPDLVLTSRGEPFRVWVNDGRGRFSESGFAASGNVSPFGPQLADLDHDGDLDLVIAGFADGPVEVWWNRRR